MTRPTPAPRIGVRLAGTGAAVPARVLTNNDLAGMVETSDEWIRQRTGIRERRVVEDDKTTAFDLAARALRQALTNAAVDPQQLDMVICATLTPDMCMPSVSARVVAEIGAVPAGAADISVACSGFVYGLNMAASMIESGFYRHIAVVGVELLSRITDWTDRHTCVLFGDGAGAAVLAASDDVARGCQYQEMHSDGGRWPELYCPRTEAHLPPDGVGATFNGSYNTIQMNGREVFKFAVGTLQQTIDSALSACGYEPSDLDMIIPHQSNGRILDAARQRLKLPPEKMYVNIERFGNTSAASIPICLHELMEADRLHEGDLVLFAALGGGLSWASSLWRL